MKKLAVIAVSLFSLASTCSREDTVPPEKWRAFEPRLIETSEYVPCSAVPPQPGAVVPNAHCGTPAAEKSDPCDDVIGTRAEAAKMLVTRPACLDHAIRELRRELPGDPLAPNDLAVAYYVRAQRENRPDDLFRALEAAEQAVLSKQEAAFFNRALIHEALGFTEEAITAWDEYLQADPDSAWATEARERRKQLVQARDLDARKRWAAFREALPAALKKGDRAAVARFIEPFPRSAWGYFEEEVLGRWAEEPTPEHLREAQLYAEELAKRTKDRYALDAVAALEKPSRELREGLLLHRDVMRAKRAHRKIPRTRAAELLKQAGSPVYLSVEISLGTIPEITQPYPHLRAHARGTRGYLRFYDNRYVDSLADFEAALAEYERLGDQEGITTILANALGVYRVLGQDDLASIAAFRARDYAKHLPDLQRRNLLLGETAFLASDLGYSRVARTYQNANLEVLESALDSVTSLEARQRVLHNLAIAFRGRATILADLGQFDKATQDLQRAVEYAKRGNAEDETFAALQARVEEVRARTLLLQDVNGAISSFTRAIELAAASNEYITFRAQLFVQRAEARLRAGQRTEAQRDLRDAIALVRAEQFGVLEGRKPGDDEALWTNYFSRFDPTYDLLIRELLREDRRDEAFVVAEQARAYEPMHFLLTFGQAAQQFRRELGREEVLPIAGIQKHLPAGTFVVEYVVLQDQTYAWIIGRDDSDVLTLPATRSDVERWTEQLQYAARRNDEKAFQLGLNAPYAALAEQVLANVRKRATGRIHLVIIPDGALQGLPFAGLRDRTSGQYLIEQATLSTAPSATFYVHSLLRDRELPRAANPAVLLFGNPAFDRTLTIARGMTPLLVGAESEVLQVAELYRPGATVRIGASATMTEFFRRAPQSEIVEIAAHGIVNPRMPFRSALLLAPSAEHDGVLDAETFLKRFRARNTRLMVLSSCTSAGGLPVGAEGVAPLVRPVLVAGVPGVLGTLWEIGDATSTPLMVSFHRHYRQSSNAAVALQNAQVELLTRNQRSDPALTWAPFLVIGHASSPYAASDNIRGEPP